MKHLTEDSPSIQDLHGDDCVPIPADAVESLNAWCDSHTPITDDDLEAMWQQEQREREARQSIDDAQAERRIA